MFQFLVFAFGVALVESDSQLARTIGGAIVYRGVIKVLDPQFRPTAVEEVK